MAPSLEIIIPLRNPTDVLRKSIASLLEQTDRNFSVLISDNGSTDSLSLWEEMVNSLRSSGLSVRVERPPEPLGRVEHWNWSHRQSRADWIKPLFVGDWLDKTYVATLRETLSRGVDVEIVNCSMASYHADGTRHDTVYTGGFHSREAVLTEALCKGNNFGGPVNICFRRLAFEAVGGYPPALPVSADFWLILMLALRKGLYTCPEVMAFFNFHANRFSTNFPTKRINGPREYEVILTAAISYACYEEIPHDSKQRDRFLRRLRLQGWKARLRNLLKPSPRSL